MTAELATQQDAMAVMDHVRRHHAENGVDGFWFAAPQSAQDMLGTYDPKAWLAGPGDGWQRVWVWRDLAGHVRAHCVVTGNAHASHRCMLAAGVEAKWRGQGVGRGVMSAAIRWCRQEPSLRWIDGWAFAGNEPVLALDASLGFVQLCTVRDVLRVGGRSLDSVVLVLDLAAQSAEGV